MCVSGVEWRTCWGFVGGRTSGQMMVVIMEAGTTMPPIPRPARTRRPQTRESVSALKLAREAVPRGLSSQPFRSNGRLSQGFRSTLTRCHDNGADDHQLPVIPFEGTEQEKHNHSSSHNAEPYGYSSNPDTNRVVAVYVERLRRPEEEDGNEVGPGDEGDYECHKKNARGLLQACRKHGEFGEFCFPDCKGHK